MFNFTNTTIPASGKLGHSISEVILDEKRMQVSEPENGITRLSRSNCYYSSLEKNWTSWYGSIGYFLGFV
ncbi:hypothetical protein BHYA_0163g00180 [Botrytis hyacinthi]|uniref:Uncharacterized protein n=1 Tax=Botrytis hyacinthi TaxID=278943 RepID=A0A4Z1GN90_9HELO|nr:hypothetical protein BHYA_0163g00180 [Botrytis hyacinthi]